MCFHINSQAKIEEFFKKAENKSDIHKMRNIDFIYMINLDERPEKFEQTIKNFQSYGIYPYRFSAVNGWKLSNADLQKLGIKLDHGVVKEMMGTAYPLINGKEKIVHGPMTNPEMTYFSHCMSRGSIGIILSHLSILQDALDSGFNTIWVMEDDVEILSDPNEISDLIEKLDRQVGDWDILFTDIDTKNSEGTHIPCRAIAPRANFHNAPLKFYLQKFRYISPDFSQIGMRYGAYSMIIRKGAMKKILDSFKSLNIFLPYDMDYWLVNDLKMYVCNRDIVSTYPKALSDNGAPNYQKKNN
jgi:GR25 family glycosyltransferase involved in LPS biosynthesis